MKKTILLIFLALLSANVTRAQVSTNAQLNALAMSITINVTDSGSAKVYTVTVPNQTAGFLTGAQRAGESDTEYVRRAFVAGAAGLIQQRQQLAAQASSISNQLAAASAKLAADTAAAQAAAAARAAALSNRLAQIKEQL